MRACTYWAGSIFKAQDGVYHAFYTGFNYTFEEKGKAAQVLMHAVSHDLEHWTKTQDALTFTPQEGYAPTTGGIPLSFG